MRTTGYDVTMDERDFYTERPESKAVEHTCPRCKRSNQYQVRWTRRTKKDRLPPRADERDRALYAFDHPCHDLPVRAFHVDVEPRVGIDPFHLGNGPFQRDRLGPVKFRRECMMRDHGCRSCQYEDAGSRKKKTRLH